MPNINEIERFIDAGDVDNFHRVMTLGYPFGNHPVSQMNYRCGSIIHNIYFSRDINQQTKRRMLQIVLDQRDRHGDVIVNVNWVHVNAGSAITVAADHGDADTVQQLLDARQGDGSPAVNLQAAGRHGHFWSPLTRALAKNKTAVVALFLDAREADGRPVFNFNDLLNALRGTHNNGIQDGYVFDNNATRYLFQYLRVRENIALHGGPEIEEVDRLLGQIVFGGRGFGDHEEHHELDILRVAPIRQVRPDQDFIPIARAAAAPREDEDRPFVEQGQNTHNTEVTVSINSSVIRLMTRYNVTSINTGATIEDIRRFIRDSNFEQEIKTHASTCLDSICCSTFNRVGSNLTLLQILVLTWTAASDRNAFVEGARGPLSDVDINDRRRILIRNLHAANTAYRYTENGRIVTRSACETGIYNKIVETLDAIHPDVTLITGRENVPAIASQRALAMLREKLIELRTIREQREILYVWDDASAPGSTKNVAEQFREEMIPVIDRLLSCEYETLLDPNERSGIAAAIEYAPKPVIHKNLQDLVTKINALEELDIGLQRELLQLKEKANIAFAISDKSFEVEYQELKLIFDAYNQKVNTISSYVKVFTFGIVGTATFGVICILSCGAVGIALWCIPGLNLFSIFVTAGVGLSVVSGVLAGGCGVIASIAHYRKGVFVQSIESNGDENSAIATPRV